MKRKSVHYIITILATIQMVAVNALANILPINGQQTGEISDRFEIYFVPAGYVFSIWGLIYLGLLAYTIYQALTAQIENSTLKKISLYYWISSVANSVWIVLWHYEVFSITIIAMLVILLALIIVYTTLKSDPQFSSGLKMWLVTIPFSIYLGWISVATIANASQLLYYLGWDGWGISGQTWAVLMILVASALGIGMALRFNAAAYNLVLVWAFIGIAVKQAGSPVVSTTAYIGVGLAAVAVLLTFLRKN